MDSYRLYLILCFASSVMFSSIFTVNLLYQVEVVRLDPLQLVLVGTVLEATAFLFEIPTGVFADTRGRRLSVIVGTALVGMGFVLEGLVPVFAAVAGAQVIWGLGSTFRSGAMEAWLVDEVGEGRANEAFIRGSQASTAGGLAGIPLSVWLGQEDVSAPVVAGGAGMIGLALFLVAAMRERGFAPSGEGAPRLAAMKETVRSAAGLAKRDAVLASMLAVAVIFGLSSEGFDRLWTAHVLRGLELPYYDEVKPVVWFGAIAAARNLISLVLTEWVRRRVDMRDPTSIGRILLGLTAGSVGALAGFALSGSFLPAIGCAFAYWAIRSAGGPLGAAWYNALIPDSRIRATMFSVRAQMDAVGQVAGGPPVGAVGRWVSLRAAILACAGILAWALPVLGWAVKRGGGERGKGEGG